MNKFLEKAVDMGDEEEYDYEDYPDEYMDGDMDYEMMLGSIDLLHISKACVFPTLAQISWLYLQMLSMCFCFQLLNRLRE